MKSSAKRPLAVSLLAGAIVIVAANAWFAFRALDDLRQSEYLVEHTWQVIDQVELIMSSAKDAETGNRGFLITGDPAYLAPYSSGRQELPAELDKFQRLTADNPRQQANIVEMRAILTERLRLLDRGIDMRRSGTSDEVESLVLSGTGKVQMDHLRRLADQIEAEEHRLLAIRTATARASDRRTRFAVGLASVLDLCLILFMFRYLRREQLLRLDAEVQAERLARARSDAEKARIESEKARSEAEARSAEVNLLNATLEERVRTRTAELETTNRELEAFSYSVSHDLRAPLRTIDGFSLALEEDYAEAVDDVGRDYIRRVRAGVQRMGQLIDALLQLSRITRAEIAKQDCDLTKIAHLVAANLQEENPGRIIQFNIATVPHAFADPSLVQVALENLLGNAVKFSSKVAQPVIAFGWDEKQEAWFVQDNGAGFDMHYRDKLFNAFNRLHGDKDFKGSGIGLATVARVVRRHHGRIWANSEVGRGAIFWFTLQRLDSGSLHSGES
jgi:signal transduction histidine kinase